MSAAAVAIKATSRGPILIRQRRCGRYGRPFTVYEVHRMCVDAEARQAEILVLNEMDGPLFKMKDDPRITPVGRILRKFSINELPQLWNVVLGDMSLVGQRPPLPHEADE